MAQDFYTAFQLNGTDSLGINSISVDGVNLAGVKALEKRTSIQHIELEKQKLALNKLNQKCESLELENRELKEKLALFNNLENELAQLQKLKEEYTEQLNIIKANNQISLNR